MSQVVTDFYRCPEELARFGLTGELSRNSGYFRFGPETLCFGAYASGPSAQRNGKDIRDVSGEVRTEGARVYLPFDPTEVINNLRLERYLRSPLDAKINIFAGPLVRGLYYLLRPILPVWCRKHLQRLYLRGWDKKRFPSWPVDRTVESILESLLELAVRARGGEPIPFIWFWPEGFSSALILTHDVEAVSGRDFCPMLMDLDDSFGFKSAFQVVPEERYPVTEAFLNEIRNRGFELNVHDLNHDGQLYRDQQKFLHRARKINQYVREYVASGFRSGAMYRNLDWYDAFEFSYDMSVPCVAHLEPQAGGACTVMPFFVGHILELPLTMAQDYSLFNILGDYSNEVWRKQIDLVMAKHGLLSFIVHPDYVIEERARASYCALLGHLAKLREEGKIWAALPRDVNRWWRERSQMQLVRRNGDWKIEGPGSERARIAYASIENDRLMYRVERSA